MAFAYQQNVVISKTLMYNHAGSRRGKSAAGGGKRSRQGKNAAGGEKRDRRGKTQPAVKSATGGGKRSRRRLTASSQGVTRKFLKVGVVFG